MSTFISADLPRSHVMGFLTKVRKKPARILIKLCTKKVYQTICRRLRRIAVFFGRAEISDRSLSISLSSEVTVHSVIKELETRVNPSFYWRKVDKETIVGIIQNQYPESVSTTITEANDICDHIFDLLGSGKTSLGSHIDWHQDFKSKYRWPVTFYADIVQIQSDKCADVKVPRELSRCHHFITLGKAYWFTKDEKYATEFVAQFVDWNQQNPPRMTINWCSTMDVAIRLVNWIWAYHFFASSPHFDENKKILFLKSLLSHAQFVSENLEYFGDRSDNHYVSNVVGLVFVGTLFPEFRQARKWQHTGLKEMFNEVRNQVHEDGVHFEGSIAYHKLVLELFASAVVLCAKNGIEVPTDVLSRLERMFEFVLHYIKPDGKAPQIGDSDNGRLQVLSDDEVMNHRYLLAVGAVLYERPDFKAVAGTFHEEALWLLGEDGLTKFNSIKNEIAPVPSKTFREGRFCFMRRDQLYMVVRCAPNGRRGIGNHSHNDTLSFELYAYDKTFIVDPGTYVYTPEPDWRNLFRCTAYHNTVVVDEEEINRFIPDRLFELVGDASPTINRWDSTLYSDFFDGQHDGYERLKEPATHRRQFYFDKLENYWIIRDFITGTGNHALMWSFHFDIGITLKALKGGTIETDCPGANLILHPLGSLPLSLQVEEGWVSPSYGIKDKAQVVRYRCTSELPASIIFVLYPHRGRPGSCSIPDEVISRAKEHWSAKP